MDSKPEYHKRDYFNFYPACGTSKTAQTENCDLTHSAQQTTLSNHRGGTKHTTQHPGTQQYTPKYPGTNEYPGITQYVTPHLGQYQFERTTRHTGTAKFPGPPLYTPYLGTAQYPGTSKQFVGRMPYNTGSQFQQTATEFSDGKECTTENPSGQFLRNIGARTIGNLNSNVFGNTDAQPQNCNSYQFTSPNVEESQPEGPQNVSLKSVIYLLNLQNYSGQE